MLVNEYVGPVKVLFKTSDIENAVSMLSDFGIKNFDAKIVDNICYVVYEDIECSNAFEALRRFGFNCSRA